LKRNAFFVIFLVLLFASVSALNLTVLSKDQLTYAEGETVTLTGTAITRTEYKLQCGLSQIDYNSLCVSVDWADSNTSNTCVFTNPFNGGDTNNVFCRAMALDGNFFPTNYSFEDYLPTADGNINDWNNSYYAVSTNAIIKERSDGNAPHGAIYLRNLLYNLGNSTGGIFGKIFPLASDNRYLYKDDILEYYGGANYYSSSTPLCNFGAIGCKITIRVGSSDFNTSHAVNSANCSDWNFTKIRAPITQDGNFSIFLTPGYGTFSGNLDYRYCAIDNVKIVSAKDSSDLNVQFETTPPLYDSITCEEISNVNCEVGLSTLEVNVIDPSLPAVYKLINWPSSVTSVPHLIYSGLPSNKTYLVETGATVESLSADYTFTYGLTYALGIQKHFSESLNKTEFSKPDSLFQSEEKVFKWKPLGSFDYWETLSTTSEWDKALNPYWDDEKNADRYSVYNGTDLDNEYLSEMPDVNTNVFFEDFFILQMRGFYENYSGNQYLNAGWVTENGLYLFWPNLMRSQSNPVNFRQNTESTYNFIQEEGGFPRFSTDNDSSSDVYLSDYMIIPAGYFLEPMQVLTVDNQPLPISLNGDGTFSHYLTEGQSFKVKTRINGSDLIDSIDVFVYMDQVGDFNRVASYSYEYSDLNSAFDFEKTLNPITDLSPNAGTKNIKIIIKVNLSSDYSEIQSDWIKFNQFPTNPEDLYFSFTQNNRTIGSNPTGSVYIKSIYPEMIKGIKIDIVNMSDVNQAAYTEKIYKDTAFSCYGFSCSFNYKITDYIFPAAGNYYMYLTVLTFAELDANYTYNPKLTKYTAFTINWKNFDTARIFEIIERGDHTYRNDEEIGLVLQLRDSADERGGFPNIRNDVFVSISPYLCTTASGETCVPLNSDFNYSWESFVYDAETGYNYFFFRNLFTNSAGELVEDGKYLRFVANVQDAKKRHDFVSETFYPLLTTKCKDGNFDSSNFFATMLNMNHYLFGCQEYAPTIVAASENPNDENRIKIDNARVTLSASQEALICLKPSEKGIFTDNLEQGFYCALIYRVSEEIPDRFQLIISNENSDLSEENAQYQQYISLKVPYQLILFNDPSLMKQALSQEFGTGIDTLGKAVYYGFNKVFSGVANPLSDIALDVFLPDDADKNGLTGAYLNVGADINFQNAYDPRYLSGILFYRVNGLKVVNAYEYRNNKKMENVSLDEFVKFAKLNSVNIREGSTNIQVYASDFKAVMSENVASKLVINENSDTADVDTTKLDENEAFTKPPAKLRFNIISDLISRNEQLTQRAYIPLTISTVIGNLRDSAICRDPDILVKLGGLLSGDCDIPGVFFSLLIQNIVLIAIVLMFLVVVVYVYRQMFPAKTV
jgi:hypothetical protein